MTRLKRFLFLGSLALSATVCAEPPVMINGTLLTPQQVFTLEQQLGTRVVPGGYLYNESNGCWMNMTTGQQGCMGNGNVTTFSRHGSGERNANGDWSHWSNMAGGAVGGSGDGCVYAFGWSNC